MSGINEIEFKQIYMTYFRQISRFIYYKTSDMALSEDLGQEVFLRLWKNKEKATADGIATYLYTIAGNLVKDAYKTKKQTYSFELEHEENSDQNTPSYLLEMKEFQQQLEDVLAGLPEKQRVIYLMNRIDDLPYREIAVRLELSQKSVEKYMSKTLKELRAQFPSVIS